MILYMSISFAGIFSHIQCCFVKTPTFVDTDTKETNPTKTRLNKNCPFPTGRKNNGFLKNILFFGDTEEVKEESSSRAAGGVRAPAQLREAKNKRTGQEVALKAMSKSMAQVMVFLFLFVVLLWFGL